MSDLEIVSQCQKWDSSNFWLLYDKYIEKIHNFIYYKTYDRTIAEDITSDTFFKILDKINSIDVSWKHTFNSFIYKVAYNNLLDFYKSRKETVDIEEVYDLWIEENIWKNIDDKDKIKEVFSFIKWLKKEHRDILVMRLWENLSYKEIAEITWKSIDNCKKIFSRNMKNINWNITAALLILLFII